MIHSLAGGKLGTDEVFDFAKLEFISEPNKYFWYITEIKELNVNDYVLAPFGALNELSKARVVRIDKNIHRSSAPIPVKTAKHIFSKI